MILGTLLNLSERLVLVYKTVLSPTSPKGRYKDSDVTSVRCFLWWTVVVARRVNIPSLLKDSPHWAGTVGWGGGSRFTWVPWAGVWETWGTGPVWAEASRAAACGFGAQREGRPGVCLCVGTGRDGEAEDNLSHLAEDQAVSREPQTRTV